MNIGDSCFGTRPDCFEHEDWEEALEAQWDQAEPGEKVLSIYEGEISPATFFDDEHDAEVHEVINAKERRFRVLKNAEYFDLADFQEIAVNH